MKRLLCLIFPMACAGALGLAARAADGPFTLEHVLSSPFPSELVAARQGSRIAWVFDSQGRRNVWVAEGPQFSARQLTEFNSDDGQEITDLEFSADGTTLVFVRGGNRNSEGEIPNPTSNPAGAEQAVWEVAWTGGAPRRIDVGGSPAVAPRGNWVAYEKVGEKERQIWLAPLGGAGRPQQIVTRGQNSGAVWSPDGRRVAFTSTRSAHSLIAIYQLAGKALSYAAPSADRDGFPAWSPDGTSIAFVRRPAQIIPEGRGSFLTAADQPNPWSIWVADAAGSSGRELWHSSTGMEGSLPNTAGRALIHWAADGRIVFASEQDGWLHLYSIPSAGGAATLLTPGECEIESPAFAPSRREIVYTSNCGDIDRRHLWRVSASGGAPEQLTSGSGIEWSGTLTGDGNWIAYLSSDARRPAMPFVRAAREKASDRMLAAQMLPRNFPSAKLVVPEQVIFDAADGVHLHGQLFVPSGGPADQPRPAVVFMHGGPIREMLLGWHYLYYYHNAYGMNQYLASRGYLVLSVNYRSGIGYGRAFRMAPGRGPRGANEYQDIVAAAHYLAARKDVDPKRIGLWGGSYGGYLTALGLGRNSDLFAAGVDLHGVHDWSQRGFMTQGAEPERLKLARESSPVSAVETWRSPVLLIQGDDDRNVNFDQMVDLVPRLRKQGVPFEQIVFPDEVHDFLLHRNWLRAYHAAAEYFDRYLKAGGAERAGGAQ